MIGHNFAATRGHSNKTLENQRFRNPVAWGETVGNSPVFGMTIPKRTGGA
jgi:hypothetical protein